MSLERTLSQTLQVRRIGIWQKWAVRQEVRTQIYSGYYSCEQYVENINDEILTRWQYGHIDEEKVWKEGESLRVILLSRVLPENTWVTAEFYLGKDKIKAQVVGIDRVNGEVLVSWANDKGSKNIRHHIECIV